MKYALLKARLSGPGGNTTGADGLTLEQAANASDVDVAGILMDPLDFYQVRALSIHCRLIFALSCVFVTSGCRTDFHFEF
jgi:hypothetical protein